MFSVSPATKSVHIGVSDNKYISVNESVRAEMAQCLILKAKVPLDSDIHRSCEKGIYGRYIYISLIHGSAEVKNIALYEVRVYMGKQWKPKYITWNAHFVYVVVFYSPVLQISFMITSVAIITVLSNERRGFWDRQPLGCIFLVQSHNRVRRKPRLTGPVWQDSPHNGPLMRKAFSCHYFIMLRQPFNYPLSVKQPRWMWIKKSNKMTFKTMHNKTVRYFMRETAYHWDITIAMLLQHHHWLHRQYRYLY